MATANFRFISDAAGGDQFSVVGFSGHEAISRLYRFEFEIKASLSVDIQLDDVLAAPGHFVTELDGEEFSVHGVLSSIDELRTDQEHVYYRAVLVPRLWWLSVYKTNEIYTEEQTVDVIVQTVLENAGFVAGTDFDLGGLDTSRFLRRDFRCQFGESDFDFLSRLMENEGIFYYFDQTGDVEKIVFVNDLNYAEIVRPDLIFDVAAQSTRQHDSIHAWSCRKQRLPAGVTVRDFNPDQPSLDISNTIPIDEMGQGTEYLYGENIVDENEAAFLSEIRAEESLCNRTRYYGESSVTRMQAGNLFGFDLHPNDNYNGLQYLAVEVNHEGRHLDMALDGGSVEASQSKPQYRNSFVAIDADQQFRPSRITPKPRFYGTMTAFIYAEATGGVAAEVDEQGRYRVHLPFDRADGTKESSDPHRKASTWIRMAQPFAGENEGMCFPLKGGTEVLLTFLNGDPDRPIISAALPNASEPSLLNDHSAHVANISTVGRMSVKAKSGSYSFKSSPVMTAADQASASWIFPTRMRRGKRVYDYYKSLDEAAAAADADEDLARVNEYGPDEDLSYHKDEAEENYLFFDQPKPSTAANYPFSKLNDFGEADTSDLANLRITLTEEENDGAHIDRTTGPTYIHKSGSTFPYPEQERVYFFGTFHEDFHMDDMGISGYKRVRDTETGLIDFGADPVAKEATDPGGSEPEVFHFPVPGGDGDQTDPLNFPENRLRGVSEDKRWGDQMFYAWGRSFNWAGGPEMGGGDTGSFGVFNYGNGYTENLVTETGGTVAGDSANVSAEIGKYRNHRHKWTFNNGWSPDESDRPPVQTNIPIIQVSYFNEGEYDPPDIMTVKTLDPAKTIADKTFGHIYSYHMGYAVNIHEGHTASRNYGDTHEVTYGNTKSIVHGKENTETYGDSHAVYHGDKMEWLMGSDTEGKLALDTEFKLAGDFTFHGGISFEFMVGIDTGYQAAGFLKFTNGIGIDKTGSLVCDSAADLEKNLIKIAKKSVEVAKGNVKLAKEEYEARLVKAFFFG